MSRYATLHLVAGLIYGGSKMLGYCLSGLVFSVGITMILRSWSDKHSSKLLAWWVRSRRGIMVAGLVAGLTGCGFGCLRLAANLYHPPVQYTDKNGVTWSTLRRYDEPDYVAIARQAEEIRESVCSWAALVVAVPFMTIPLLIIARLARQD